MRLEQRFIGKYGELLYAPEKLGSTDPEVDSAYLSCYYFYFNFLLGRKTEFSYNHRIMWWDALKVVKLFMHSGESGLFRRHPDAGANKEHSVPEAKFNFPYNLSRDNTLPIVILLGELGMYLALKRFMWQTLKRGSFFQNKYTHKGEKKILPDMATPDHWCTFIRAYVKSTEKCKAVRVGGVFKLLTWLLLCGLDFFSVLQTVLHVAHTYVVSANDTGSELNFLACALHRSDVMPTPLGELANWVYGFRRFPTEPAYERSYSENNIVAAVENFFGCGKRAYMRPPIDALVRELWQKGYV